MKLGFSQFWTETQSNTFVLYCPLFLGICSSIIKPTTSRYQKMLPWIRTVKNFSLYQPNLAKTVKQAIGPWLIISRHLQRCNGELSYKELLKTKKLKIEWSVQSLSKFQSKKKKIQLIDIICAIGLPFRTQWPIDIWNMLYGVH